jgi:uncharacterized protein YbjT (DUF2867 family)
MILVVGSTGLLGTEVCRQLSEANRPCRALVRKDTDPEKIEALKKLGAELVYGDLKDPDSLKKACAGASQVISTASSTFSRREGDSIQTVDHDGQLNLVQAAKDAGVDKFVFVSFPDHPTIKSPLSDAKRAVEEALAESGMNWTSLWANWFMEVWLSPAVGFDYPNGKARIYGTGDQTLSWISFRDVAKFAVEALDNSASDNQVVVVGGPRPVSPNEVVRIFEKVHGKSFEVEHIPAEALVQQRAAAVNPLEESFAALMLVYAEGTPMEMDGVLKEMPVELMSVEEYAKAVR